MEKKHILLAQAGDADAYATVFSVYEVELYKLAYVQVGNHEDSLDLVQETAYRSFKYIRSLKQPEFFKTWLIRILLNATNDLLKKRYTYEELDDQTTLEDTAVDTDVRVTLDAMMTYLTPQEKQVVYLKIYEDMTLQQITELLDTKLGSTKTIYYRALGKLKAVFREEDTNEFKGGA